MSVCPVEPAPFLSPLLQVMILVTPMMLPLNLFGLRLPEVWGMVHVFDGKLYFCTERRLLWLARPGRKALARQAFFREGREPETKFNRGLSTAARCCPPLPYLNETWQPRYRQTQSRGLCLIPEGCTVAVWG